MTIIDRIKCAMFSACVIMSVTVALFVGAVTAFGEWTAVLVTVMGL